MIRSRLSSFLVCLMMFGALTFGSTLPARAQTSDVIEIGNSDTSSETDSSLTDPTVPEEELPDTGASETTPTTPNTGIKPENRTMQIAAMFLIGGGIGAGLGLLIVRMKSSQTS